MGWLRSFHCVIDRNVLYAPSSAGVSGVKGIMMLSVAAIAIE